MTKAAPKRSAPEPANSFSLDEQCRQCRDFIRRHIVDDAPPDLDEVEAAIDRGPRRPGDVALIVAIGVLNLAAWLLLLLAYFAA